MNLHIGWRTVLVTAIGVIFLAIGLGMVVHTVIVAIKTLIFFGLVFGALLWIIEHKIRKWERERKGQPDDL